MKLLILASSLPLPPTDGGKIRVLNLLRRAATEFDVTVLALQTEATDDDAATDLRSEGITTILVPRSPARVPPLTPQAMARALTRGIPLAAAKYYLRSYRRALAELLESTPFDLVHFEIPNSDVTSLEIKSYELKTFELQTLELQTLELQTSELQTLEVR